ncbi:DUF5634 family protein [Amphibacillus sediminis]|uniref:DUF5634 family protein n=1 Tax=Amphibacillus sediminis TaxID=360185 RepID=UPI0008371CFD|nr:DUF5634 family protein [Amphibacillus sediminis]
MDYIHYKDLLQQFKDTQKQIEAQYSFEHVDLYEKTIHHDILNLGYRIRKDKEEFHVYLRYLHLDQERLLPFTPIWTCRWISSNSIQKRGYDTLLEALLSIQAIEIMDEQSLS